METRTMWKGLSALATISCLALSSPLISEARADLDLHQAELIALGNDPAVQALAAESSALAELSVAAGQLPDPVFRVGMMSLPVDSFDLGQEPMTQVLAGVVQKFPRGQSRALERRQLQQEATALDYVRVDQQLQVLLEVRQVYVDTVLQLKQRALTESVAGLFADLVDITRDFYGTGRVQQQDVLRAAVELGRIQERSARFFQEERQLRAGLSAYIGDAAMQPLQVNWPTLPAPEPIEVIKSGLLRHPKLQAWQERMLAADTGVELAQQRYKPEFAVDVSYGARSGDDTSGMSRPDLFSIMLVMDLPLFPDKRQDRVNAASVATSSAVAYSRDDAFRRLLSDAEGQQAGLEDLRKRLQHYEEELLPQANFNADASFEAYQSALGDLASVLRARINEYELKLEYVRLQAEELKSKARLLYLQGDLT